MSNLKTQFQTILEAVKSVSAKPSYSESVGEPTEADLTKYKKAAKKMIQVIKDKSPDWKDEDGSVEKAFFDNMVAMKKGDLQEANIKESEKPRNLSLDDAMNSTMRKHSYEYDEDGIIYSFKDPLAPMVKNIRAGISKYVAVRGGLFRINKEGVKQKIQGNKEKSIGKNTQEIVIFQDGSTELI